MNGRSLTHRDMDGHTNTTSYTHTPNYSVTGTYFELMVLLSQTPEYWNFRPVTTGLAAELLDSKQLKFSLARVKE